MKSKLLGLSFCLIASGCATTIDQPKATIKISNFKLGYVCPASPDDPDFRDTEAMGQTSGISGGEICRETNEIVVTANQKCIYAGQSVPCTWYGYEYEYENVSKNALMDCISTSNVPINEGNPEGVRFKNAEKIEFSLEVEPGAGRYYNPLYMALLGDGQNPNTNHRYFVKCKIGVQDIFEYDVTIVFPRKPADFQS